MSAAILNSGVEDEASPLDPCIVHLLNFLGQTAQLSRTSQCSNYLTQFTRCQGNYLNETIALTLQGVLLHNC